MARGGTRAGAGRKPGAVSKAKRDLAAMAKEHAEAALKTLTSIAQDTAAPAAARVSAATAILDRGYGRPAQAVQVTGKNGERLMPTMVQIVPVAAKQDDDGEHPAS